MSYKNDQYLRVETLIGKRTIFGEDTGGGEFKKKSYSFVLKDYANNLYNPCKKDILDYFEMNKIAWWGGKLTNHTLSSQVACLNHLFPIREDKNAVLSIIRNLFPDITDVLKITTDNHKPAYIQFEVVSNNDNLNELTSTRGRNCTSLDALIYGIHKDGRKILFPIEWKYVESYNNENKSIGNSGEIRKKRYTSLINKSAQLKSDNHDIFYYEPFYQLMRQTLWTEQIIANKGTEIIQADDYIHIHVIPAENRELLNKVYLCSGKEMEETWRSCLKDQSKYRIISPEILLSPVIDMGYQSLCQYLEQRYW